MSKKELEARKAAKMRLLFMYMWTEWDRNSDLSGKKVGNSFSTTYFHHILPKSKYKRLKYSTHNIIRITADEHHAVEDSPKKYKIINDKRKHLLDNYEHYCTLAEEFEWEILEPLLIKSKGTLW